MYLLILVACLGIERYLHVGSMLNRFSWVETYLVKLTEKLPKDSPMRKGYLGAIVAIFPIMFVVGIILLITVHLKVGLSGLGVYFIILLYCFGPNDLFSQSEIYFASMDMDNKDQAACAYKELTGEAIEPKDDANVTGRKLTEKLLTKADSGLFGVICWYIIFGILGVLGYRLISIIARLAKQNKAVCEPFAKEVIRLNELLEWLPSRLTGLFYVLVNGKQLYSFWASKVFSDTTKNKSLVIECGLASLEKLEKKDVTKEVSPLDENKLTMRLIDKALVIFVAAIMLVDIILWI